MKSSAPRGGDFFFAGRDYTGSRNGTGSTRVLEAGGSDGGGTGASREDLGRHSQAGGFSPRCRSQTPARPLSGEDGPDPADGPSPAARDANQVFPSRFDSQRRVLRALAPFRDS